MSLKNMALATGATLSAAGGTALTFASNGQSIQNGVQLIVPADADYATRRSVTVKYRPPTLDTRTQLYTKDKKTFTYVKPLKLATGQIVFNLVRVEREVHPDLSAEDALDLLIVGAQMCFDADVVPFWAAGSMD